jgi:hypothetical protein
MWGPHSDAEVASEPLDGSRIRLGGGHP